AAYLASPLHAPTWAFFSPRFLALGLPLAIAAAPPSLFDAARGAITSRVVAVAMAIASLAWSTAYHARLAPIVDEVLGGLDAPIRRTGPRLPLMLSSAGVDPELERVEPIVMLLHAYTFDQGGVDPYLFATVPSTDSILYRAAPEALFGSLPGRFLVPSLRCAGTRPECPPLDEQYAWFSVFGRLFEDVIVFADDPSVVDALRARGYTVELQRGRLAILRPGRCRVDVHLGAAPGVIVKPPVTLVLGQAKVATPVVVSDVDASRVAEGTTLTLEGPDCGPLWLRIDADGLACAEGAAPIALTATATSAGSASCTLVRR
ncbi:hypothetical protein L6R52_32745, partial [Myxococcota bacterium]|nr:hypothetical protein [Myxococcota bacterium]